ncbi:MAG: hypothetical protein ACSHX3_06455 [Litorimonas sp.]
MPKAHKTGEKRRFSHDFLVILPSLVKGVALRYVVLIEQLSTASDSLAALRDAGYKLTLTLHQKCTVANAPHSTFIFMNARRHSGAALAETTG